MAVILIPVKQHREEAHGGSRTGRIIYRPSRGGEVPVIDSEFAGGWRDA
jgi:hypothetical protein